MLLLIKFLFLVHRKKMNLIEIAVPLTARPIAKMSILIKRHGRQKYVDREELGRDHEQI